ncbi:MAG TPA: PAS domain S-box protein, partial [Rhodospirillaceae bacterium]|nr:PAS domain S-box protein [Rhodospirillaceae bacterium]
MTKNKAASVTLDSTALATFPKPAMVIDSTGRVVAANEAAGGICEAMDQGQIPGINAAVGRALASRRSQSDVIMVPGTLGPMLYDVNVLPNTDGCALVLAKDVTLESNLRATLVESRQRYKDLVEISTDFAWELGDDGSFVFVSPRGALGHSADHLVGRKPADFITEQAGDDGLLPFVSEMPVEEAEVWMRRADGTVACLLVSSSPLLDADGRCRGSRGVCRDVTKERERDAALARANNRERLLNYIVRTIRDVVDPTDILGIAAKATARALGAAGCQIFRHDASQFIPAATFGKVSVAQSLLRQMPDAEIFEGVVDGRPALGSITRHHHDVNGSIVLWREAEDLPWGEDERAMLDDVANQIGIANEQIANHERILLLSRTDALTGLFNRRAFFEELARRFSRLARDRRPAALIYVDLDNF